MNHGRRLWSADLKAGIFLDRSLPGWMAVHETETSSPPISRTVSPLTLIGRCAQAGLVGGALVWAIECADLLSAINIRSPVEAGKFVLLLAPSQVLGLTFGVAVGGLLVIARLLVRSLPARFGRALQKSASRQPLIASVSAGLATVLALAFFMPDYYLAELMDLGFRAGERFLGGAEMPTWVADAAFGTSVWFVVALASLAHTQFEEQLVFGGRLRLCLLVLAIAGVLVAYGADSRFEYTRHDNTFHLFATAMQFTCALFAASAVFGLSAYSARGRRAWRAGLVSLALVAAAGLASGFWLMPGSENLKALVWHRSTAARRYYQLVAALRDHDGDGFTPAFAGPDLDDTNADIQPYQNEIPDNGLDDNCIGGDATAKIAASQSQTAGRQPTGYDLILISVDTLRADRLGCYGYGRSTTPRLDALAARGRLFERAYSQATCTAPAFACMNLSALREQAFNRSRPTLFGTLRDAGYRTCMVNARSSRNWIAWWRPYRELLLEGIDEFVHESGNDLWDADRVTDAAIAYLEARDASQKHATWIHYLDPHLPRQRRPQFDFGRNPSDVYDSEVAFTDQELGRLFDYLAGSGLMSRSIVVFMSDHGEAFGEHGIEEHAGRPYDHQLRIPLIIWAPDVAPGRVGQLACTVDIAPTVLAYLGLPELPAAAGVDLLRADLTNRAILSETDINHAEAGSFTYGTFYSFALTWDRWRLNYDCRHNTIEVYDLLADPAELHNLADDAPELRDQMMAKLGEFLDYSEFARLPAARLGPHSAAARHQSRSSE
jgi:arylsulfatase A-like enzyme